MKLQDIEKEAEANLRDCRGYLDENSALAVLAAIEIARTLAEITGAIEELRDVLRTK